MKKRIAALCLMLTLLAGLALPVAAEDADSPWTVNTFRAHTGMLAQCNVCLYHARRGAGHLDAAEAAEHVRYCRESLLANDARPSDAQLRELGEGTLIGDDTLDVWGYLHQVGDYEVYELQIMDRITDDVSPRYISTLTQGDFDHVELFCPDTARASEIAAQFQQVLYAGPTGEWMLAASAGIDGPIGNYMPNADTGSTKSYRIYADALSAVYHFYVRPTSGGAWKKTMTTTCTTVVETHEWYFAALEAKGDWWLIDYSPDETAYLNRAVAAYESGVPVVDCLDAFTATVTIDGEAVELYTLDYPVPDTREWGMIVIFSGLGAVVLAGLVFAFSYGHRRAE